MVEKLRAGEGSPGNGQSVFKNTSNNSVSVKLAEIWSFQAQRDWLKEVSLTKAVKSVALLTSQQEISELKRDAE